MVLLKVLACKDDKILEEAVNKEMEDRGHKLTNWKVEGKSKMWARDNNAFDVASKSHHFNKFSVSGDADVLMGGMVRMEVCEWHHFLLGFFIFFRLVCLAFGGILLRVSMDDVLYENEHAGRDDGSVGEFPHAV